MTDKKISVVIPARNEEGHIVSNIECVCDYLHEHYSTSYEVIVVDDCSSDDTFLVAVENLKHSLVRVYRKTVRQGKGAAIKTGWKFCKGEYIVIMDADLQIKPRELDVFFKHLEFYEADVVIGNKRHIYSNVKYGLKRWVVSNTYNFICRVLFGISLRDTQCGFKLFKKSVLDKVMSKMMVKEFAFDVELMVALKDNNFRIVDAPVFVCKPLGSGSVRAGNIFNVFKDTVAVWFRRMRGWYQL